MYPKRSNEFYIEHSRYKLVPNTLPFERTTIYIVDIIAAFRHTTNIYLNKKKTWKGKIVLK